MNTAQTKQLHNVILEARSSLQNRLVRKMCEQVINFLASHRAKRLNHITLGTFLAELKLPSDEANYRHLLEATEYLCNSQTHLLNRRFTLILPEEDDHVAVDDATMAQAFASGNLIHPKTGEPVEDFKDKLYPYFEPTVKLRNLHE